tara:strand:- start:1406 stop:1591 length:186 start_codon:yes stop_codon:yes gene_type:complete
MILARKMLPNICKEGSCLEIAEYEFTDVRKGKTVTLAYACHKHIEKVRKLLETIYAKEEIH